MSLSQIVRAKGGDLYAGGCRASIPGPGHSRRDRSASLLLNPDGRVVVYSFGASSVADILADLLNSGLIDRQHRITGSISSLTATCRPIDRARQERALQLWREGSDLPGTSSEAYLARHRAILRPSAGIDNLRHYPAFPVAVYAPRCSLTRPSLMCRIESPYGDLTAIEVTYLDGNARRDRSLRISRKTVGCVPRGAFVRLDPLQPEIVAAEGVMTALSAGERFSLPAFALLGSRNLRAFVPPTGVRKITIAADRGAEGEESARELRRRLADLGLDVSIALPRQPFDDFNRWAQADREQLREKGRVGVG